jgi:hypothetical protein
MEGYKTLYVEGVPFTAEEALGDYPALTIGEKQEILNAIIAQ